MLRTSAPSPFELAGRDRDRLLGYLGVALRRARGHGSALAAVTIALEAAVDPTAVAAASRRDGEDWFVSEAPDRGGFAIAALGCAHAIEASGPDRFGRVAARWRELAAHAACDRPPSRAPAGPLALGGFAFADEGGASPHWAGYAAGSLQVPEVVLARRGDEAFLTLAAVVAADDTEDDVAERLVARAASLVDVPLPLLDPHPSGVARVVGAMPPEHYESAVRRAVERIRDGHLEKIVLAREVQVHAAAAHDPAAVLGVLRTAFPSCYVFAVGRGESTFLAASPELLVRREGARAGTLALAGSTRRSADPAVDDHLGEQLLRSDKNRAEQDIVTRRIVRTLRPHSVWVTTAEEPVVVKMANIQHLATPIRAQLASPVSAVELAGILHPTPAVGGEPNAVAARMIPELEGLDRGWYAGPVGWTDIDEDGEFCVALRCALLEGRLARCYAGVGVVADSDPHDELLETETKLEALLPVLAL